MQQYQTATTTTKDAQQPSTSSAAALDAAAVSSAFSSLISSASGLQPLQPVATGAPATQATTTGQPQAKRKQVKNACTNCQKACKKCDDARPCPRCIKYGISGTCVNSVRKERKKGIKRGPYKRRQKTEDGKNTKAARVEQGDTRSSNEDTASRTNGVNPPTLVPYGYPGSLQQYAQHLGAAAAYGYKEQVMSNPNSFVVGAVYPSSLEYPMVVPSNGDTQHKDQSTTDKDGKSTNEAEDKHATAAVPDASTSSGTSSPDSAQDEDATRFERLTQLCTAALKQNDNNSSNNNKKKDVEGKSED
ncbi:hypothetical protein O0I10_007259 [Lichtheimia ornata]|uniref:Zn(2)-C6 fungal-type domain-containing protein n=1 Tax=Lichtheimia ornata TaxID=688661 RepID=A0AAD7V287_9FUNG|nr:uncharacterized protein O0I10_007259 [Lichtheimia ornata]KAJ8656925.1 hypothetical protein O0I10_007259 [Lichtheimia ornata]